MRFWLVALACVEVGCSCAVASIKPEPEKRDSATQFSQWATIKDPLPGATQPIGTYSAGCLAGAVKVESDGVGFALMRLSRHRGYAHPDMLAYLHALGEKLQSQKLPLLLVGDVGPPRGGPMLSGHASHQIGLDADLWLRMAPTRPTLQQREAWGSPTYVRGRKKLRKNWSPTQVNLLINAAGFETVNRIFVSPAIKKYFCQHFPEAEWLYKLRAWWGHDDHVHVRLSCPAGSGTCQPQTALNPSDNGCGADLEWWFSAEADAEWTKMTTQPQERLFPPLPPACDKMPELAH